MRRRLAALGLACALAVSGCAARAPQTGGGFVAGDGSFTAVEPARRGAPVELAGKDLDGRPLDVAGYRGQVVVLNVWGSWCPPCRAEAPALVRVAERVRGTARLVGLDTRDAAPDQGRAFQRTFATTWPSLFDPDGALLLRLGGQVPPNAIPTTLVLDAQGRVAARVMGSVDEDTLVAIVSDVAAGR